MINQNCPEPAGPDYSSPNINIEAKHFEDIEERRQNEHIFKSKNKEEIEKKNLFYSIMKCIVEITRKIKLF